MYLEGAEKREKFNFSLAQENNFGFVLKDM
jgi:hypothetical protein